MSPPIHKPELSVSSTDDIPLNSVLKRSEELYLDDGNVIVAAKDVAFRVHRSQLARHSEVFRNMFVVVSSPSAADMYDGCHVVRLSDSPDDVLTLLRAIYDNLQYNLMAAGQLACILRMSGKFMVDSVYRVVLEALQQQFPPSLEKWDSAQDIPDISLSDRLMVLRVAYETNAQILLPASYYGLCSHTTVDVLRAGKDLPSNILATYPIGKDKLALQLREFMEGIIAGRSCYSSMCIGAWKSLEGIILFILGSDFLNRPIFSLKLLKDALEFSDACWSCRHKFMITVGDKVKVIWASLPEVFGMVSWEHLRQASTH